MKKQTEKHYRNSCLSCPCFVLCKKKNKKGKKYTCKLNKLKRKVK